ncbi:hypothetical protein RDWZM_006129 [Blomia tropicalis]|uniref:Uncharacterized protein n=1 Tax=Blomia tropicalis TaxID=40697 RepID=A0A9Q0M924_BLOTA|nr:hypothetical protein RDWZM_006129 [Blomia tropicalis]
MSKERAQESKKPTSAINGKSSATLCTNNCGFFGNANYNGACSKCFRERLQQQEAKMQNFNSANNFEPIESFSTDKNSDHNWDNCKPEQITNDNNDLLNISKISSLTNNSKVSRRKLGSKFRPPTPYPTLSLNLNKNSPNIAKSQYDSVSISTEKTRNAESMKMKKIIEEKITKKTRKPPKPRCAICPQSIAVIAFDCRCGRRFCIKHQLANTHQCNFDYRAAGAEEIRKANPKVIAKKI